MEVPRHVRFRRRGVEHHPQRVRRNASDGGGGEVRRDRCHPAARRRQCPEVQDDLHVFPRSAPPSVFEEHLDHFLRELGEPASEAGAVQTNRQLFAALHAVPSLSDLSTQELGYFLYHWADPRSAISVFKIAPGEQAKYWSDCLEGGYICVGWDEVGDLTQFADKDEFPSSSRSITRTTATTLRYPESPTRSGP